MQRQQLALLHHLMLAHRYWDDSIAKEEELDRGIPDRSLYSRLSLCRHVLTIGLVVFAIAIGIVPVAFGRVSDHCCAVVATRVSTRIRELNLSASVGPAAVARVRLGCVSLQCSWYFCSSSSQIHSPLLFSSLCYHMLVVMVVSLLAADSYE